MRTPRPYANPYSAGVGLGLVLLCAFVLTGQGLGASGAFATVAAEVIDTVAPAQATSNTWLQRYLETGSAWVLVEVVGVIVGGAFSAFLAGRMRARITHGAQIGATTRLASAAIGGMFMGSGAVLARGCTSGLALSGGALLSVGSWAFMLAAFATGFAFAPLVRRLWQ